MLYMVTFTINIPPMLAYIPYMDPMGNVVYIVSLYPALPWQITSDFAELCQTTHSIVLQNRT